MSAEFELSEDDPISVQEVDTALAQLSPLVQFLSETRRLSRREARAIVIEVLGFLAETQPEFVARRHRELQQDGYTNPAIFAQIQKEFEVLRFRAAPQSDRQLRRQIYG